MTERLNRQTRQMAAVLLLLLVLVPSLGAPSVLGVPLSQQPDPPVEYSGDNNADGIFGNTGDSLLDSDTVDSSGNFTVTSAPGWPTNRRGVISDVALANASAFSVAGSGPSFGTFVILWEDTDSNGVFGNSGDTVLDCDSAGAGGGYYLATPVGWGGQGSKPAGVVYAVSSTATSISGHVQVTAN